MKLIFEDLTQIGYESLPTNLDYITGAYPVEGVPVIQGNDVIVELNDVSSGSMIIAFQLWAEFTPDRNGETLTPLTLDYCRRDRQDFKTQFER